MTCNSCKILGKRIKLKWSNHKMKHSQELKVCVLPVLAFYVVIFHLYKDRVLYSLWIACHGAHKLDLSTLFTTFFLWTSPPFILKCFVISAEIHTFSSTCCCLLLLVCYNCSYSNAKADVKLVGVRFSFYLKMTLYYLFIANV